VPPAKSTRSRPARRGALAATLLGAADPEPSLLDLVDSLLHKGVVVDAELVIALADVDLLCVRLGAVLGAVDRVLEARNPPPRRRTRRR
jgi:hypothetical protein